MQEAEFFLKKYWKHESFRPLQKEIIDSVLDGKDTFGLLPTGGGKSVCFQIPALMRDGICLVISPLVALMKDQVSNLQKLDIKAIAITGGLQNHDVITLLDNCQFGNYKFLYVSPERLESDWVLERIKSLPLNLIAIDEAHCVSQWGHDFRPAYLKISNLKSHFPKIPFLALTASATKTVEQDSIAQLKLDNPTVFRQSFGRDNLAYMVFEVEDKLFRMEQILKKNPSPSIVYVRNRKSCLDISSQLQSLGIKSTFYHGGLSPKEKDKNMELWMSENVQVIVATNAFGMGIDKSNVKTVIHIELPESLENYYQEAGRAGRNSEKAYAIILTSPSDKKHAEAQFISVLADKDFLKNVYIRMCNYFQIAYGEGIGEQFSFNLNHFCSQYQFPILKTYHAIQFLDRQGIISLSQEFSQKIYLQFIISSKEVIRYISLNQSDELVILTLLRTYSGIYEVPTAINLSLIAKKSNVDEQSVSQVLERLKSKEIINYQAKNNDATLIFNDVREDELTINRVSKYLENQNNQKKLQLKAVINYISDKKTCKSKLILSYFGEQNIANCGICSVCIKQSNTNYNLQNLVEKIVVLLKEKEHSSREIELVTKSSTEDIIFALQELLERDIIIVKKNNKYALKS
jgi:ATP-dependent DNA helicase RecQ